MKSGSGEPKIIILVTLPNGSFGGAGGSKYKNDVSVIASELQKFGYQVAVVTINELLNKKYSPSTVVIYTSSDEPNIRKYVSDVISLVSKRNKVVPGTDSLLAHENKGFQELLRAEFKFGDLQGKYIFDFDDLPATFPYVYKSITGAGSKHVHLIRSDLDKRNLWSKYFRPSLMRRLILFIRRFQYSKSEFENYLYRHKGYSLGVVQEFIPGLSGDFKILIFGDRYYVLRRGVRPNDFRASGSGLLTFESAEDRLLDYAESIFRRLNEPFASLDIAKSDNGYCLIEYQVLNFGPYTLKESPGHYQRDERSKNWVYLPGKASLELEFAMSIDKYLRNIPS